MKKTALTFIKQLLSREGKEAVSKNNYQLNLNAAEVYESQKVNAMFRPLAEATLEQVLLHETDIVLDIACGTGIISRCIARKVQPVKAIVGVDLNEGMIEIARSVTKDKKQMFEWHCANVTNLPFDDNSFSIAFCQQGLQFFPDKAKALEEIKRVLMPDGRLILTVWSGISPLFEALAQAIEDKISQKLAVQSLAPFAFRDEQIITDLIGKAGFSNIETTTLTIKREIGPAQSSLPREIAGNPVGVAVMEKGQAVMDGIVRQVEDAIAVYRTETGFSIPQETFLIETYV